MESEEEILTPYSHSILHSNEHGYESCNHNHVQKNFMVPHVENESVSIKESNCSLPPNACSLLTMMIMVAMFSLVELAVGFGFESLTLLSDGFHMISDCLSLGIGFVCVWLVHRATYNADKYSYGWHRAETVGALVNGVFLLSTCMFIILESIVKMASKPQPIQHPWIVFGVGVGGLLVNFIGLLLFFSHRSLHVHSSTKKSRIIRNNQDGLEIEMVENENCHGHSHSHGHSHHENKNEESVPKKKTNANLHGVFLHILGDALGSVVVIVSSLCYIFLPPESDSWKVYIDPVCSLLFSFVLVKSSIVLIKHTSKVLLQAVPDHVDMETLRKDLSLIEGVNNVHELNVWSMDDQQLIGTVHLHKHTGSSVRNQARKIFCHHGIHRTTIQQESFTANNRKGSDSKCKESHVCKHESPESSI